MGDIEAASGIPVFSFFLFFFLRDSSGGRKKLAFPLQIKAMKIYHYFGMGVPKADRPVGQVS